MSGSRPLYSPEMLRYPLSEGWTGVGVGLEGCRKSRPRRDSIHRSVQAVTGWNRIRERFWRRHCLIMLASWPYRQGSTQRRKFLQSQECWPWLLFASEHSLMSFHVAACLPHPRSLSPHPLFYDNGVIKEWMGHDPVTQNAEGPDTRENRMQQLNKWLWRQRNHGNERVEITGIPFEEFLFN